MKRNVLQMFVILLVFVSLLMVLQILKYGSPLPSGYATYIHTPNEDTSNNMAFDEGIGRLSVLGFSGIVLFLSVLYISLKLYKSNRN